MLGNFNEWYEEKKKSKWFRIILILIIHAIVAISINIIDKKSDNETEETSAETSSESEETDSGVHFHIGIGHVVMLVILVSAYGINRAVVYRNKLEDDKKYSNKEDK